MRVGLVSDVHAMPSPPAQSQGWHGTGAEFCHVLQRLDQALDVFAQARVDVIALAGDLAHHGDQESIEAVFGRCAGADVPVLAASGNHDVAAQPTWFERALSRVENNEVRAAGPDGEVYAGVRIAGVHVGATVGWFGAQLDALPDAEDWGDEPVVLISHYPALSLASEVAGVGFPYPGDLVDRAAFAGRLLARNAPTVVVGGHVHVRATRSEGPVLQFTGGAMVEPPYECAIVDVTSDDGGRLVVRRQCHRLRPADGVREPVLAAEQETWRYSRGDWVPAASLLTEGVAP